jgi:hypothetical protein
LHSLLLSLICFLLGTVSPSQAQTAVGPNIALGTDTISSSDEPHLTLFFPVPPGTGASPGPLGVMLAKAAKPGILNRRLIIISHGSGGSPWVHTQLAAVLVQRGYVVAMPAHRGDHFQDSSEPGPESWKRRPHEISASLDRLQADPFWSQQIDFNRVGAYGQSAGGHTVLSLAGGRWSTQRFLAHCKAHLHEDFNACVGAFTRLRGSPLDGLKTWLARLVLNLRFHNDSGENGHFDPRIAAVVAGNPYVADFDPKSLEHPRVPLGIVSTGMDRWLKPKFHSERLIQACKTCDLLVHWPLAGHGALLSPFPSSEGETVKALLTDGEGFDRGVLHSGDKAIADFFDKQLMPGE